MFNLRHFSHNIFIKDTVSSFEKNTNSKFLPKFIAVIRIYCNFATAMGFTQLNTVYLGLS